MICRRMAESGVVVCVPCLSFPGGSIRKTGRKGRANTELKIGLNVLVVSLTCNTSSHGKTLKKQKERYNSEIKVKSSATAQPCLNVFEGKRLL